MPFMLLNETGEAVTQAASTLSNVVTSEMMSGVFNEIVALLPVVIPTMVGFIAIRKGISFVSGILRSA